MATIMGTNTPATGRENKLTIKVENKQGADHGQRGNYNVHHRNEYTQKENLNGAGPNLQEIVLNQSNPVQNRLQTRRGPTN